MNNREKMLAGKVYDAGDPELMKERVKAHDLCILYNTLPESHMDERNKIIDELLPQKNGTAFFQGPIFFDYGSNISFGQNFYANYNFSVLDCNPITIGDDVMIGMNCSLLTSNHPLRWQERNMTLTDDGGLYAPEFTRGITIEKNCWIASNVTIIGGVVIGEGSVIGAGSVVTKSIPANSLAAGNPAKVIRTITEEDSIKLKKELW